MKKLLSLSVFAMLCISTADAQVGKSIKKAGKSVGHKTAEVASKGASRVSDQKYEGKVGPGGQTIYIDDNSKYYWVDDRGKKHYVQQSEIRDAVKVKEDDGQIKVKPH